MKTKITTWRRAVLALLATQTPAHAGIRMGGRGDAVGVMSTTSKFRASITGTSVLAAAMALTTASANARLIDPGDDFEPEILYDNFDDNYLSPTLWTLQPAGTEVTVQEVNQRLEISFPANPVDDGGVFGNGVISTAAFNGDFDFQVDFELLDWPYGGGVRVGLIAWNDPFANMQVERSSSPPDDNYVANIWGQLTFVPTSDASGTLRIQREGDTFVAAYWDAQSNQWVIVDSATGAPTGEVRIYLWTWSHPGTFGGMPVKVAFDNVGLRGPLPPELLLEELITELSNLDLSIAQESLDALLQKAIAVLTDENSNNDDSAILVLKALKNYVNAQTGKKLTVEEAELINRFIDETLDGI